MVVAVVFLGLSVDRGDTFSGPAPPWWSRFQGWSSNDDGGPRRFPPLGWPLVCGTAGGVALGSAVSSERVRRSVRFQAGLAVILSRYVAWWALDRNSLSLGGMGDARNQTLEEVHERTAVEMEELVRQMRGAYVKSAQILSSAFPETLPAAWVRRLETLVDDAPARPWPETKRVIERELGSPLEATFLSFDPTPVAAASVGQVHRATLKADPEREVAVKIQYPGVENVMIGDLENIRRVVSILKPALLPAVDEFRMRVSGEFDYAEEGARADGVKLFFDRRRDFRHRVVVPASVPSLTTSKVLVMDWLEGGSLRESLRRDFQKIHARRGGLRRTVGLVRLRRRARKALELVVKAHGAMIFDNSAFTVDPHPGNIIACDSATRKIGVIDFGNFKIFTPSERLNVARLYAALLKKDTDAIVRAMIAIGFRSQKMDPDFVVSFATQCFDRDVVDASPYQLLQSLEKKDRLLTIPSGYMLVCRVSLLVRGLARRLGYYDFSCADLWRNEVKHCLRHFGEDL